MHREQPLSHCSHAQVGVPVFLTVERASQLLEAQGYRPLFRFQHVHAIEVISHDERHVCLVTDLATLTPTDFLLRVAETFRTPGYTHPPFALPSGEDVR